MKRKLMAIISVVLCICLMMPVTSLAADTSAVTYESVEEYVEEAQTKSASSFALGFYKALNKISNFFINDFLKGDYI